MGSAVSTRLGGRWRASQRFSRRPGRPRPVGDCGFPRRVPRFVTIWESRWLRGRLELLFLDEGTVAAGSHWTLTLTFRGPTGPATLRVLLGWAEESLAVESPEGPALAVQRLARSRGWHRLTLRFGTEQTEIAVDGKELAHGKGPPGPLDAIGLETKSTGPAAGPADLAGIVGEIHLVRFAEPPASLEIDPSQDEVRLVVGDQLYGTIDQRGRRTRHDRCRLQAGHA